MHPKKWACTALMSLTGLLAAAQASHAATNAPAAREEAFRIRPTDEALTFAQVDDGGRVTTILVVAIDGTTVRGIDLSALSDHHARDAFDVVNGLGWARVEALAVRKENVRAYPARALVGVGPRGAAQIAAGTNYPEHGRETGMDQGVFLFPKFSESTGPAMQVSTGPGVLLDYEAEVCARFDREIRTLADFDSARKGFFLCGDFSDRAELFREINLKDPYSGDGFPDAKSGPDRFPAGPFLVVPKDWRAFLAGLNFKTFVDGQKRQDVNAADMLKDLRAIVDETLEEGSVRTWSYQGGRVPMVRRPAIGTEAAVLTGTGDGVVFQAPGPALIKQLMAAKDRSAALQVIGGYVNEEDAKRIYLQPGSRVRHSSNYLGWIDAEVILTGNDAPAARDRGAL